MFTKSTQDTPSSPLFKFSPMNFNKLSEKTNSLLNSTQNKSSLISSMYERTIGESPQSGSTNIFYNKLSSNGIRKKKNFSDKQKHRSENLNHSLNSAKIDLIYNSSSRDANCGKITKRSNLDKAKKLSSFSVMQVNNKLI